MKPCCFSVNVNKFALVRNSRDGALPNIYDLSKTLLSWGVGGITVHPRPDQRHIRYDDLHPLSKVVAGFPDAEFNIEGFPSPEFIQKVCEVKPHQVTLVPDDPGQKTSDHGWDISNNSALLSECVAECKRNGIRVSLFMDPVREQIEQVPATDADRIELYTEQFAALYADDKKALAAQPYTQAAQLAQKLGLKVNAGHDLNLENLGYFLRKVPDVKEVSIGHAFVCEAWNYSLKTCTEKYLEITQQVYHG